MRVALCFCTTKTPGRAAPAPIGSGVRLGERLRIRTPRLGQPVGLLSGGNQQKVVLAKWLARKPRVFILDEPTRGVDIGATEYIHQQLLAQRAAGTAILLISEDLDEIIGLSDRIAVMYEGRIMGVVARARVGWL